MRNQKFNFDPYSGQYYFYRIDVELPFRKTSRLWRKFYSHHNANPHIYQKIKDAIFEALKQGRQKYSIGKIIEHIRWDNGLKVASMHRAYYSRIFVEDFPELKGFFRFGKVKTD